MLTFNGIFASKTKAVRYVHVQFTVTTSHFGGSHNQRVFKWSVTLTNAGDLLNQRPTIDCISLITGDSRLASVLTSGLDRVSKMEYIEYYLEAVQAIAHMYCFPADELEQWLIEIETTELKQQSRSASNNIVATDPRSIK